MTNANIACWNIQFPSHRRKTTTANLMSYTECKILHKFNDTIMKFKSSTKRVKIETKSQLFTQSVCADVVTFVVARSRSVETLLRYNSFLLHIHTEWFVVWSILWIGWCDVSAVFFRYCCHQFCEFRSARSNGIGTNNCKCVTY